MMGPALSILGVILGFGVVIFVHELGHFVAAKRLGMKVERFSFGLGPELIGFRWGETRYCLAWIPLGGEVRLTGETPPAQVSPEELPPPDPRAFFAQPWYRRLVVVIAGPLMNYVCAAILFALVIGIWGDARVSEEPVIGRLIEGMPAQAAGLKAGDWILSVNLSLIHI